MPGLLILCEYPTLSGGERSMLATLDAVRRAGFAVTLLVEKGDGGRFLPGVDRQEACPTGTLAGRREWLAEILGRRRPDLLHANSLSMGRLAGPVAAELGIASLAHLRDIVGLSGQAVADVNRHCRLLAVSEATRRFHVAAGLDAERTFVLHNGVDLERFRPRPPTGDLHRELGLAPQVRLIGAIGQLGLRKGLDVLLRAAAGLAAEFPDVHYLLVGERWSEKDESRRFETQLHALAAGPLAGRVHFLGLRDDVDRLLNELTLLVHPARQEPLGRVLLEAAACGRPIVATAVGGTPEIFPAETDSARLVPPDAPEALAGAMAAVLSDTALQSRLGHAARRRAEEAFSIARAASGLIEHYRAVLGR